jgi:hypothetical protein
VDDDDDDDDDDGGDGDGDGGEERVWKFKLAAAHSKTRA